MKNYRITGAGRDYFVVPRKAIKYIPRANEPQLKALLYCMANPEFNLGAAASECGVSEDDFRSALEFWQENKLITVGEKEFSRLKPAELIQTYDSETLSTAMESEPDFSSIKGHIEDLLGKVLNRNDVSLLYNMYHFAGMNADYICTVAAYAAAHGMHSILGITRTAFEFYDNGADTYEKLEIMLSERQVRDTERSRFISLCGMGSRQLSQKENNFITKWFSEFEIPFEVVRVAYDRMVDSIGEVSLPYLDTILTDWHKNGVKDAESAKAMAEKRKTSASIPEDSFDAREFIDAAMKKGVK